ncbi:hypothetical protein TSOC_009063 [Tetrabaena socialis]|uniref:DUF2061 domain-containing protein n=1 Tax=Tetrabaena socialis TaxID=47790 RepID=A0A2J7ZWX6_9CHLO|nr:hypothetical protein TSOC_009063 [Tetrabaena socialis]|eukprot:PNH04766.1 hypothetical protein TSOC_009063 [Tetrabaena socialis]
MQSSMQASTSMAGERLAPRCQPVAQRCLRRPLRQLCALSLDRSSARKNKPAAPASTAIQIVDLALLPGSGGPDVREEEQAAYEQGYQAGLAAARQGQDAAAAPHHDSMARSLVKAFSWRFFSTAATIALTMAFFSATLDEALEMGAAEFVSKFVLYLIHERLWILVTLF